MSATRNPSGGDLVVVGGGPAGLATAIFAAQSGMRVTVLERGALPVDKACGEGLMPSGVRMLDAMGVRLERTFPFDGIRYVDPWSTVEARFGAGRGLGIRRSELSRGLVDRAAAVGVEIRDRVMVRGVQADRQGVVVEAARERFRGQFLVGADGLHSRVRRFAGLEALVERRALRRYGFRRHHRIRPWSRFVEVHWTEGAEAYVTPVGEEEVGVAFLWHQRARSYEAMLARFPAIEAKLGGARPTTELKGAGPFRCRVPRVHRGRVALVGDAAGYLDAITGEGVALGFHGARALVESLISGISGVSGTSGMSGAGLEAYERSHRRLRRRYVLMTELALVMAARPRLRRVAIGALSRYPGVFRRLVDVTGPGRVE